MTRRRPSKQAIILVVALGLWSIAAEPALWAMVAAYGVAWLGVNAIQVLRPRILEIEASRPALWLLAAVLVAPPAAALYRAKEAFLEEELLLGIEANARDRLRLEASPAIAPGVVFSDHPQTFYVRADGERLRVRFGAAQPVDGVSLGEGLFRISYDPRRDGLARAGDGEVSAEITVDGDATPRTLEAVHPLAHPRWLRPSPERALAVATSEETDEIAVVGPSGLIGRWEVGDGPTDAVFISDDRVAVAHRFSSDLRVLDARTGRVVRRLDLERFQVRLAASDAGTRLAVAVDGARAGVYFVSLPAVSVEAFVELSAAPDWIAFGPDDDTLVVSSRRPAALHVLERGETGWRTREPFILGRPVVTMARAPGGDRLIVAVTDFRPSGEPHQGNHFIDDQLLTVEVTPMRVVDRKRTQRRSPRQGSPGNVDRGVSPMGVDVAGDAVLVAFAGSEEATRIDPTRPTPTSVDLAEHGIVAPHGIASFADGSLAVSSPAAGLIGVLRRDGTLASLARLAPDDDALLREAPEALKRRMGERGFYESTRSGVSCQSCHLHADSDGALHNVGEGRLSPTLTVRGVAGTAPYLRDGSYPRVRDLDDLARTLYRGFLRDAPSRGLTLEAFVYALPREPSRWLDDARDLARERAGVQAFVKARCVECHAFPAFTNLSQHPAGVLFPATDDPVDAMLDTPSLALSSPPYLSDGRAETLSSVLRDHDDAGRHGEVKRLSDREIDDLVYFLESL